MRAALNLLADAHRSALLPAKQQRMGGYWKTGRPCWIVAGLCVLLIFPVFSIQVVAQVKIDSAQVFQSTGASEGKVSYYLEIKGEKFSSIKELRVFVAPQQGLSEQPQLVSSTDSLIAAKFTGPVGYFPAAIGVAGTGLVQVWDVPRADDPGQPKIDDVEVLALDRTTGTGRIKIDGRHFGEPKNIRVAIIPYDPGLPVFAPVAPRLMPPQDNESYYGCGQTPEQETTQGSAAQQTAPAPQQSPPSIRSESTDNMVLVDFSFPCYRGVSVPFRIARVVLTIAGSNGKPATSASYDMTPPRDKNLLYHYSILATPQAVSRFGRGIAKNFYAVQLSIVNRGPKKVQIPLAAIQAEVDWTVGRIANKDYLEGPATVAPVPLAGAVSFFSKDRKSSGPRAILFNGLQGLTTIGSAIQSFFGHGFTQGVAIFGGGFRQGLGQIFQDLSDEQLANLTSQSFESTETVSGNGGSIEKVVFIQRGEEEIESYRTATTNRKGYRVISDIDGFEITAYEASETPGKTATAAQQ